MNILKEINQFMLIGEISLSSSIDLQLPVYRTLETDDLNAKSKFLRKSFLFTLIIYFSTFISCFLTTPFKSEDFIIIKDSIFHNNAFNIAKIAMLLKLFFLILEYFNSIICSVFDFIL